MRNLLRKPLPWMVLMECAVVAALIFVAWHVAAGAPLRAVIVPPGASAGADAGASPESPAPDVAVPSTPPSGVILPGLNVDAGFWRVRLAELNRGETEFELLEWRLVHSAMDAARRYVESVVIPSVLRAQRSGR